MALDAIAKARGANAPLIPLLRVAAATADRDKAVWDLHLNCERAPPFLALCPSDASLKSAAERGEAEFEEIARLLPPLFAAVPPWKELDPEAIRTYLEIPWVASVVRRGRANSGTPARVDVAAPKACD